RIGLQDHRASACTNQPSACLQADLTTRKGSIYSICSSQCTGIKHQAGIIEYYVAICGTGHYGYRAAIAPAFHRWAHNDLAVIINFHASGSVGYDSDRSAIARAALGRRAHGFENSVCRYARTYDE